MFYLNSTNEVYLKHSCIHIFHLFHYTINIIKKGATVLQNVSKTYLVYKNESGLSSVEAAAAAAATEA